MTILSSTRVSERIGFLAVAMLLSLPTPGPGQSTNELSPEKLAAILGSSTNDWRISTAGAATSLTCLKRIEANAEVTIRLRLGTADRRATWFHFAPALKTPDDPNSSPLLLLLSVAAGTDQERVTCQMPALTAQSPIGLYFFYTPRILPANRLAWPAMVRARAEEDFASTPSLVNRWLTLRYVVRNDSAQIYLDGKLVYDTAGPYVSIEGVNSSVTPAGLTIQPDGYLRLTASEGVQLAEVRIRRLPAEDPLFEVVPLDGTKPIDLGRSWMRFGALEGAFDGGDPELPRWNGVWTGEAGRICFSVRNAPYRALHLLAAFDGDPDNTAIVTAQFYRPNAGLPVSYSARVPKGKPRWVTIPLEPEGLAAFADMDTLHFELTKEVRIHRAFPDPAYYSEHGAGLPSGVRVYAMTLERPAVAVELQPDQFAHIWTSPEKPSYTIRLRNHSSKEKKASIELSTLCHDGSEKTAQKKSVRVPAGGQETVKLPVEVKRYGYHEVALRVKDDQGLRTQTRSLAYLHPDTRERGGWEDGKGPLFGFWDMKGGQGSPGGIPRLQAAVAAGAESSHMPLVDRKLHNYGYLPDELAFAEAQGMVTHFLDHSGLTKEVLGVEYDPSKPAEMEAKFADWLKKLPLVTPTKLNKPEYVMFFGEPHLGPVTMMSWPEYYGDPPYQLTVAEQTAYKKFLDEFLIGARTVKKTYPHVKCFMPWGTPTFVIPFLRQSKEATELLDGPAIDCALFERLPEMQMHQVTYASVLWQFKQEWIKAGKPWPQSFALVEGGPWAAPAMPGALTMQQEADHTIRSALILCAYGVTRQYSGPKTFHIVESYGEQHYGGGLCARLPLLNPKPAYAAYATMTRQLNRMNFVKSIDTGSTSVFCLQFKHYKTGELLHVLWTLRGKRPVTLENASEITVSDSMDNKVPSHPIFLSPSPCYVRGLTADARILLGEPDHSDAKPAAVSERLDNLRHWTISAERDNDYETAHLDFIKKFPAKMSIRPADNALAIHLEPPEKERQTMPFYTTLVPSRPITIPGKPSHLGLWVRAASDWGRFVYCLRDATGERWLSVGKKGEWNVDDIHCWSAFNFDGWRYLRFEMPGNAPWDCFREAGTSFWGYYGEGDGIVDLPLSLEKIIVERRTHVIKVDELVPANPADVLLGDLYAEYEKAADRSDEAIRLSRLRMPKPTSAPAIENPIQKLTQTGLGQPTAITKVEPPAHEYDGTRCHVFFEPVASAASYDVWVSTYADGRGAVRQGANWPAPGQLLTGLPPSVEVYLFITYTDKDGKVSRPSTAKRILLKDDFPFK